MRLDSSEEICCQQQQRREWGAHHAHLDHSDGITDIQQDIASEFQTRHGRQLQEVDSGREHLVADACCRIEGATDGLDRTLQRSCVSVKTGKEKTDAQSVCDCIPPPARWRRGCPIPGRFRGRRTWLKSARATGCGRRTGTRPTHLLRERQSHQGSQRKGVRSSQWLTAARWEFWRRWADLRWQRHRAQATARARRMRAGVHARLSAK